MLIIIDAVFRLVFHDGGDFQRGQGGYGGSAELIVIDVPLDPHAVDAYGLRSRHRRAGAHEGVGDHALAQWERRAHDLAEERLRLEARVVRYRPLPPRRPL